ncbi:arginine decarboxylase, partial [Candidatus Entotheonella serta]
MQKTAPLPKRWSTADAVELYGIKEWSNGFFRVSDEGNIEVTIPGEEGRTIDVKALVDELRQRGLGMPLLLRFSDVLRRRIGALNEAFQNAI